MSTPDVIALLTDEMGEAGSAMAEAFAEVLDAEEHGARLIAIELYLEHVRRIGHAAEILELAGLQRACRHLEENTVRLGTSRPVPPETRQIFAQWPTAVLAYLSNPTEPDTVRALAALLCDRAWPAPLPRSEADALQTTLRAVASAVDETPARQTTLPVPEDVSLAPDQNTNPRVMEAFLNEGSAAAAQYAQLARAIAQGEGTQSTLQETRRIVHTLKGAANTVGVRGVAALAHHVEDILEALALSGRLPASEIAELLLDVGDCLEMMFDSLIHGHEPPPQSLAILERLVAASDDRRTDDMPAPPRAPLATAQRSDEAMPSGSDHRIAVPAPVMDALLRLSSDITIGHAQARARLRQTLRTLDELREYAGVLSTRANDAEHAISIRGVGQGGAARTAGMFDALELDEYSELHGRLYAIAEGASDIHALARHLRETMTALEELATDGGETGKELHDSLVRARMVPAANFAPRLSRIVAQTAATLGKEAKFVLAGDDVMLDAHILKDLLDPLVHLVRNAVDHGLEAPTERAGNGKSPHGTIAVSFGRAGNEIVIEVGDDGRGLDFGRIREVAEERGLIGPDAQLDDGEIARLILVPGLSTAAEVSYTSGRGVGMDVVHAQIRKLKGRLDIASHAGCGCRFTLRFPVTLGLAHCLLAGVAGEVVAVPTESMERAVYRGAQQLQRQGDGWSYRDAQVECEARELAALLGYAYTSDNARDENRSVILVKDGARIHALVVDALIEGTDLVIKNPGSFLGSVRGLAGASLLPDGRVVPVLDIGALLRTPTTSALRAPTPTSHVTTSDRDILVVDDSLTVRNALSELLSVHGFAVRTARDGVEALELIAMTRPAIVILDLEMPRMNGLELAAHLRAQEATRVLPLILITSRSSAKHRTQTELAGIDLYLTKPYLDVELLGHLRRFLAAA